MQQVVSGCAIIVLVVGQGFQDGFDGEFVILSRIFQVSFGVLETVLLLRRVQWNAIFLNNILHYLWVYFYFLVCLVLIILQYGIR